MRKIVFILSFFFTVTVYTQGQSNLITGGDTTTFEYRVKVPKQSIVLNLGYKIPLINNSLIKSDFWNKKLGTGINFGVDYRRQLQQKAIDDDEVIRIPTAFAFGAGLGFSYLYQSIGFDNLKETLTNYTDKDGDNCTINLNYQNVKETASLIYLDIPLYLEIGKLSRIKISGYFNIGATASILISKTLNYEGTYTSIGYYPQWDVTLDDMPGLGYFNNASCYNNPEQKLSPFVIWGTVSGGVNFPFSSLEKNKLATWILRVGAKIDYSLTPVSQALPDSYFTGSQFRLNQTNMLGGDGSRILTAGLSIGLIYCL
jgi:hypothetical protein